MWHRSIARVILLSMLVAACAPAGPAAAPTAAPTLAPAKPPAPAPAAASPAVSPASSPVAKPAVSPVAGAPSPGVKPSFNEQAVADFYRGKTLRLIVGSPPGGGYDTYSRLIARSLGKHIPGNPQVIVENMPGAGFLVATNHAYNVAPKDGTVIVNFSAGLLVQQALGTPGVEFDGARFQYLGVPTRDTSACVATKASGIRSIAETMGPNGRQFIAGGAAPGNPLEDDPALLREVLGANIKTVPGYDSTAKVRLAMDQGEVEGMCGWSWESIKATGFEPIQKGDYVVIAQNVEKPHPDLPNVPVTYDLIKTDDGRRLFRYAQTLASNVQRQYAAPPGVPQERVQALRVAFEQTFADSDFRADADKAKLDVNPIGGEEAQRLMTELLGMPDDIKTKLKQVWRRQ